ncbi:MAG: DUF2813 domain-containing protein [Armatimonadetes bacterium]|nr:DUF2813 domain-containing protein [Armatimonadota bacterium]
MNRLTHIHIEGFKSIREADLDLRPLNVLIGTNASGKSSLLSLFRMLNFAAAGRLQVHIGQIGGAEAVLHYGSRTTSEFGVALEFGGTRGASRYRARLAHAAPDTLLFADEVVEFGFGEDTPRPATQLGSGHKESQLSASGARGPGSTSPIDFGMGHWRFYQFNDTSATAPARKQANCNDNRHLAPHAENLAAYLHLLHQTARPYYERIVRTTRLAFPEFDDFDVAPLEENPQNVKLSWREVGRDKLFGPHDLSDGTLRFMALTTLLLQPEERLPDLILIDEPELGLHPSAIALLGGMLRSVAALTEVIVATQSVRLVDEFDPEDIVVTERRGGATTFERLKPDALADWLEDYSVGELWEKNVIGGRP